jgi:hypothetical protein
MATWSGPWLALQICRVLVRIAGFASALEPMLELEESDTIKESTPEAAAMWTSLVSVQLDTRTFLVRD